MVMDDWMILSDAASINAFADQIASVPFMDVYWTPPRPVEVWNDNRGARYIGRETYAIIGSNDGQDHLFNVIDHVWTHRSSAPLQSSFPNAATRYVVDISSEGFCSCDYPCSCVSSELKDKGTKLLNDHDIVINAIWLRDRNVFGVPEFEGGESFYFNSLDYGSR